MNPYIVGVDPGATGAIALLDPGGALLRVEDMPVVNRHVNAALLHGALYRMAAIPPGGRPDITVVIEQVSSMPHQGVASSFKFGRSLGVIEGVCAGHGLTVEWVTPTRWKRDMRLTADKEESRRRAIERWPLHAERFARKSDEGRAEACLIALWALGVV